MKVQIINLLLDTVSSQGVNDSGYNRYKHLVCVQNTVTKKNTHFDYHTSSKVLEAHDYKDVLQCLYNDAVSSEAGLGEFCADLGYNPKNTDDIAVYEACKKIYSQLKYLSIDLDTFEEQLDQADLVIINDPTLAQQDEDYYATI